MDNTVRQFFEECDHPQVNVFCRPLICAESILLQGPSNPERHSGDCWFYERLHYSRSRGIRQASYPHHPATFKHKLMAIERRKKTNYHLLMSPHDTFDQTTGHAHEIVADAMYLRSLNEFATLSVPVQHPETWPATLWANELNNEV
jgi:hypothetical protein